MVKYMSRTLRSSALSSLTSQRIIFDSATMPLAPAFATIARQRHIAKLPDLLRREIDVGERLPVVVADEGAGVSRLTFG
jgi:hypothetical protein